ncbi:substrate-binding domain-containing protein [Georgenia sp. MJ170]|uniref:substrate-binding domain-containing protein n=1 Tax=Georgenia sunbinii TaxID=3117728 RepID=UPI002F262CD9
MLAASTVLVAALTLAACGGGDGDGGGDATNDAGDGNGAGELVTVGFVAVGPEGAWRQANEQNIQDTFTEDAGYDLKFAPATNLDQASQISAFTSFVDEGVDVILLSATEGSGWEDSLRRAQEAEIPVILIDRGIEPDDTDLYVSRIAPDNLEVSSSVAEWAISEFPEGARYFVLEGPAGVSVVNERNEGWDAVIGGESQFEKVGAQTANWSTEEARGVFETVLQSENNEIDMVFAQNDEMGLGAALAAEAAGLEPGVDVKIATIDGTQNALEALAEGRLSFVAEYNPLFGETAMEVVESVLAGEEVESYIIVPSLTFDSPEAAQEALPDRKF